MGNISERELLYKNGRFLKVFGLFLSFNGNTVKGYFILDGKKALVFFYHLRRKSSGGKMNKKLKIFDPFDDFDP